MAIDDRGVALYPVMLAHEFDSPAPPPPSVLIFDRGFYFRAFGRVGPPSRRRI
jgi:hypothetical protein